jgi:hypothetical protein
MNIEGTPAKIFRISLNNDAKEEFVVNTIWQMKMNVGTVISS